MSVRTLRYNTATQHFTKSALASTDRDALAFLEAAQIYNTNQQRAIVNLVRSLKRVGLWSKMKAIYPFVGGTASSHKWNLKDPQDTNAAGRLTFSGGWTHNANGITGNGTNTIAYVNRTVGNYVTDSSAALSLYNRSDITGPNAAPDFGAYTTGTSQAHFIFVANTSNVYDMIAFQAPQNQIAGTNLTARSGFWVNTRTSTTSMKVFRNNAQIGATNTTTSTGYTTLQNTGYVFGSSSNGGAYPARNYAFASIGDGLTDSDATNLYNIVDLYQKRLGRAV